MMALKRTYHVTADNLNTAKRFKKLENTVYRRNLGEIKHLTGYLANTQITNGALNAQCLTSMAAGANQGQRIGNQLRAREVIISGEGGNSNMDIYLIQSRTGAAPTYANFTPTVGGHLTQGVSQEHFRVVQHFMHFNTGTNFRIKHRFTIPMKVHFTGPTAAAAERSTNHLYLVCMNHAGDNFNVQWSYTLKYTD